MNLFPGKSQRCKMRHIISVLVKNESGILSRLSNLFSSRGYVIESMTIAPSLDESYARATIVTMGDDAVIEQIIKQLNKLIPVIKVEDMKENLSKTFELVFIKVETGHKFDFEKTVTDLGAKIIDNVQNLYTIQIVCKEEQIKQIIESLKPFDIKELVRSGAVSI